MRYTGNTGIAILTIAILLLLVSSVYITKFEISDTDPSTYVIAPLLMLPVFSIFMLKNKASPRIGKKDLVIGAVTFAAFLLLILYLRFSLSFLFVSFRVDLLLLPLAIAALVIILFGLENLGKFKALMIYALLASPAVLLPIIKAGGGFTVFNTVIVYGLIKPFVSGIAYSAPITIRAGTYSIGIGQTCVSLGIFVAMALFMIPVAYFYKGRARAKILWVASGVLLLFVLNVARMLGIAYYWLAYGPSSTVLLVHTFIGSLLFYLAIIAMLLLCRQIWHAN